jgi:2-polyprenyl-6-methoxyphenol hydroxylase-like FAD-dependent oxidoreductase
VGLLVLALITLTLALRRTIWGRITGNPLPRVHVRPGGPGGVRRLLDGIGKERAPIRTAPATPAAQVEQWRRATAAASSPEPPTDCEVLVVGAGPSGLMTAALLARHGVAVRIVDAGPGPATESRAFAVQARTVELFRSMGLADELIGHGVIDTGIEFHIRGKHVGGLDFDRARAADTPYQFILMAPQNEIEEVLLHDLARHGVFVERGSRLESFTQNGSEVRARLSTGEVTCRYIVGADGAHSTVRKHLGLSFDGEPYAQHYLLADCRVEWPFDHTHFRIFMNGARIGLFLPLRGTELSRVMATDLAARDGRDPGGTLTMAELQTALRQAMNVPVTLSDPVWTTRYKAHLRRVERYRVGRGFLVGDAAHIHSPAGGQGMNTGLQDAANLAWKLAAVLHTGAGPALLDSYHDERHPVGVQLLRFTDRLYKVAADLHGWRARLRDTIGPFLLGRMTALPVPHRKAFRRLSQTRLAYRPSPFLVNQRLYSLKGPFAGHRAPDARISTGRTMFDLLQGYRLHVVALSRRHLDDADVTELTAQLSALAGFGGGIEPHLVGRVACRRDERVEHVGSVHVFEQYGLLHDDSQALYVIRPDGYVAWRMDEIDFDACRSFLTGLHGGLAAACSARRDTTALAA